MNVNVLWCSVRIALVHSNQKVRSDFSRLESPRLLIAQLDLVKRNDFWTTDQNLLSSEGARRTVIEPQVRLGTCCGLMTDHMPSSV